MPVFKTKPIPSVEIFSVWRRAPPRHLGSPHLSRCPLLLMSVNFCDNKLVDVVFEQYVAHVVKFEWVKHRFDFFHNYFSAP
jgi:hypothetical protein